jgi:uncharacterized protein (DUF1499 family)
MGIMIIVKWLVILIVVLVVAALVVGQMGLLQGRAPNNLGLRDGKLKPPSKTPNSVSSQAGLWPDHPMRAYAEIAPLAVGGDPATAMARLKAVVEAMPGAKVIESRPDYLYAQFTTRLMKYVDDTEFWLDPAAGAIQVRSASRVGGKDYGVNRKRVEDVRRLFAAR